MFHTLLCVLSLDSRCACPCTNAHVQSVHKGMQIQSRMPYEHTNTHSHTHTHTHACMHACTHARTHTHTHTHTYKYTHKHAQDVAEFGRIGRCYNVESMYTRTHTHTYTYTRTYTYTHRMLLSSGVSADITR